MNIEMKLKRFMRESLKYNIFVWSANTLPTTKTHLNSAMRYIKRGGKKALVSYPSLLYFFDVH